METIAGNVDLRNCFRGVQNGEDLLHSAKHRTANAAPVIVLIEPFQLFVSEALDHAVL